MNFQRLLLQGLLWRGVYFISMLLVNVFISRYLQAASTGVLYFLSNIFSFSLIVVSINLESGITFFASGERIQKHRLLWLIIAWSVILILIVAGAMFCYINVSDTIPGNQARQYYFFALTYIVGLFFTNCVTSLFYAQNNFLLPNAILAAWNLLLVLMIPKHDTAGVSAGADRVLYAYFLVFFLQGLSLIAAAMVKTRALNAVQLPDKIELKKIYRYASVAMLANIVFFLVYRVDYLFVNASPVCTPADLGNYIQVSKLGQLLLVIPQIIASVVFPSAASGKDRKGINESIMIIARLLSQLFLLLFLVVLFFGNSFFIALFGSTFNAMKVPMLVLIPGIFSLSVLCLLSAYFSGKGKVRVNVVGAVLAMLVTIAGDWIFVPRYGIVAAAIVSTISYTVNMGYALYVFYKDYSINLVEFFKWRRQDYLWLKNLFPRKTETGSAF